MMGTRLNYLGKILGVSGVTQRFVLSDVAKSFEELGLDIDIVDGAAPWGALISLGTDASGNIHPARFALGRAPTPGDGGIGHDLTAADGNLRMISPDWMEKIRWINAEPGNAAVLIVTTESYQSLAI